MLLVKNAEFWGVPCSLLLEQELDASWTAELVDARNGQLVNKTNAYWREDASFLLHVTGYDLFGKRNDFQAAAEADSGWTALC